MKVDNTSAALRHAAKATLPVLAGYAFLGTAYGIIMTKSGFSLWLTLTMSILVFAGSLQFAAVTLLLASFNPAAAFFIGLAVNARHIVYGISMLPKYKDSGKIKPYLIFGLTDETFSLVSSCSRVDNNGRYFFYVTLLDHLYWISGSVAGAIIGNAVPFSTNGLEFVLTALFAVLFLEKWQEKAGRFAQLLALATTVLCVAVFGSRAFLLPAIAIMLLSACFIPWQEKAAKND